MSEITREYLENIGFSLSYGKEDNVFIVFDWSLTHEGFDYWSIEHGNGVTHRGKAKIDEMIRVWETTTPPPEHPAIEYCITAGRGRLIDYGVTTELTSSSPYILHRNENWEIIGASLPSYHIAPTTTACQTGA